MVLAFVAFTYISTFAPVSIRLQDRTVPGQAIDSFHVVQLNGQKARIRYARDGDNVYPFPSFDVVDATESVSGSTQPLFRQGKIAVDANWPGDQEVSLSFDVLDVFEKYVDSDPQQALRLALNKDGGEATHVTILEPAPSEVWDATVSVLDRSGKPQVLGSGTITRAVSRPIHEFSFNVPASKLKAIGGLDASRVQVELSGSYPATYLRANFQVRATIISQQLAKAVGSIDSSPGRPAPDFIVPVGGLGKQNMSMSEFLSKVVSIQVIKFANGDPDPAISQVLLQKGIDYLTAQVSQQLLLTTQSDSTRVSFLLDDGLKLDMALSEINKLDDFTTGDITTNAKNYLSAVSKKALEAEDHDIEKHKLSEAEKHALDAHTEGGYGFGLFTGELNGATSSESSHQSDDEMDRLRKYSTRSDDENKEATERFLRDISQIHDMVTGRLNTFNGMKASSFQELGTSAKFESSLESLTALPVQKSLVTTISLGNLSPKVESVVLELKPPVQDPIGEIHLFTADSVFYNTNGETSPPGQHGVNATLIPISEAQVRYHIRPDLKIDLTKWEIMDSWIELRSGREMSPRFSVMLAKPDKDSVLGVADPDTHAVEDGTLSVVLTTDVLEAGFAMDIKVFCLARRK